MMNYKIIPLGGDSRFDLNGVRFDGKSFMYWKKKSGIPIKQVSVVFDKKHENIPVQDGVMILSLKGLQNYSDLEQAIQIFMEATQMYQVSFQFIVENEMERKMAEELGSRLQLSYGIQQENLQAVKKMEESIQKQNNSNLSMGGNQMIETYQNGKLNQYTVSDGVAYENRGMLTSEEEKVSLLREWMKDPVKALELSNLSEEARNDLLNQTVMANKKKHYLEDASQQKSYDQVGEVAIQTASREGGMVNGELGIIQNQPSNANQYSVVEKEGDNVRVVNPNVVNFRGSTTTGISNSNSDNRNQLDASSIVNQEEQQEQQRDVEQVFYIDEDYHLYDSNGKLIGKVGVDGYMPDYSNNTLLKNGQLIGYIGDYKDLGKNQQNVYNKPKVKTFKKETFHSEKSAAFIRLPVIIFVLSALLLIASIILLFVVE